MKVDEKEDTRQMRIIPPPSKKRQRGVKGLGALKSNYRGSSCTWTGRAGVRMQTQEVRFYILAVVGDG